MRNKTDYRTLGPQRAINKVVDMLTGFEAIAEDDRIKLIWSVQEILQANSCDDDEVAYPTRSIGVQELIDQGYDVDQASALTPEQLAALGRKVGEYWYDIDPSSYQWSITEALSDLKIKLDQYDEDDEDDDYEDEDNVDE